MYSPHAKFQHEKRASMPIKHAASACLDMGENTKGLELDFGATMQKGVIHPMHCI